VPDKFANPVFPAAVSIGFRLAGEVLSRAGGTRLTILIFHRVLEAPDPLRTRTCDKAMFEWQMRAVADYFNVLPLGTAVRLLATGDLPARAACITFDDGYADNASLALPILQKYGLSATFFIATGFLDGGRMWNDSVVESIRQARGPQLDLSGAGLKNYPLPDMPARRAAIADILHSIKYFPDAERTAVTKAIADSSGADLPDDLMMSSGDVRALADAGMEIGGHTVNHPIMASLSADEARTEIMTGKQELESLTGQAVSLFAYPNGIPGRDFKAESIELLRESGFVAAVTTAPGVAKVSSDRFQLPRFTPWDRTPRKFLLRLLQNYTTARPASC